MQNNELSEESSDIFLEITINQVESKFLRRTKDSSRYYIVSTSNPKTKQNVFMGFGFAESNASQEFYQALVCYFEKLSSRMNSQKALDNIDSKFSEVFNESNDKKYCIPGVIIV